MQITGQLSNFVGPALAGLIIASLSGATSLQAAEAASATGDVRGIGVAIGFDMLTFVVSAIALWMMKGGRTAAQSEIKQNVWASIVEGMRLVWNDPIIRTMIFITAGINLLFSGPMAVGIPVLAKHLPEGAAAFGAIISCFGGGALVGAILAGSLPAPRKLGIITMVLIGAAGAALGLFGFVNNLLVAIVVAIGMGLAIGYVNVASMSWLQKRVPAEKMGRVMSLVMLGSFGLVPISNFLAGVLADNHLMLMFGGAGLILVLMSLFSLTNRDIRAMGS